MVVVLFSRCRFAAALAALLCLTSFAVAANQDWYVEKDNWVETYLESTANILRLEQERGATVPAARNERRLPLVLYPKTFDRLNNVEFDLDVSGVQTLYIGGSSRFQLQEAQLFDDLGAAYPLLGDKDLALPYERSKKGNIRADQKRLELSESEVALKLDGKFKRLAGKFNSGEMSIVVWFDAQSHYEQWSDVSRERRDLWNRIERGFREKYKSSTESDAARDQVNRIRFALPTFHQPASTREAAALFTEILCEREAKKADKRIGEAVRQAAAGVNSAQDFERLVRLSHAVPDYWRLRSAQGAVDRNKEFTGLATSFKKLEDEFFQLDPDKVAYGMVFQAKLDSFIKFADACKEFDDPDKGYIQIARNTIEFVDQVRPVTADIRPRLEALAAELESKKSDLNAYVATQNKIRQLRRQVLFSHPALDFDRILINRNPPPKYSHNGDQHLGRHSRVGPGLTILSDWKSGAPKLTMPFEGKLPVGAVRNPDLHYDAEKVAFAFCDHSPEAARSEQQRRFFLYEAALDGSWVRQLTGTARDPFKTWNDRATVLIEDNDPCYLPDGGLVFISTRGQSFGRCHGGRYNPAWILYRSDGNGDGIQQLSWGNENEYEPSVLNDGRIVFTRWEYTNRHEMFFHMLWWCRPDGGAVSHFYGNDTIDPMMVVEASAIAGTHRIVATAQGHHSYNTGTTIVLDTDKGENGEAPVKHITPETPYSESHGWPSPHFSHPSAITEDLFLVSRANHRVHSQGMTPPPADRAIYLVDTLGGRELIYEDLAVASFSPIPIRKRLRPMTLAPMVAENAPEYGTVFLHNAYLTRNDPEGKIKPGSIKALRINALGVQPRAGRTACSMTVGVEIPKKVLGTVAVEADGSAHFKIPARTSVQMQILDENGLAILTEKSLFYLQPGERRSCVGCHEPTGTGADANTLAIAARMTPKDLTPAAGPQYKGGLSFMRTVQPVLDRYCISCHGLEKTEKVNLVHDGQTWPQSYKALVELGDHRIGLKGYKTKENTISRPFEYFAYGNKTPHMLLADHGGVKVDRESFLRIVEWLDLNAQCYGDLFPNKLEERRIDGKALAELRAYVKELFGEKLAAQPERALINVAQPDESRILMAPLAQSAGGWGQLAAWKSKDDPGYRKMVELTERCIVRKPNENTNGWEPTLEAGAGERWVIEAREKYLQQFADRDEKNIQASATK